MQALVVYDGEYSSQTRGRILPNSAGEHLIYICAVVREIKITNLLSNRRPSRHDAIVTFQFCDEF